MSSRLFVILVFIGTLIAAVSLVFEIIYIDPTNAGFVGISLFFVSLFLTLLGVIFGSGNWLRRQFFKKQLLSERFKTSLRQAAFFSILLCGWLWLKSHNLASWWVIIIFILLLTALEFLFISLQKNNQVYGQ